MDAGRRAAQLAALNGLAVAHQHLGSLDKVTRIIRLGVSIATSDDFREHPKVADGASDLLQAVWFAKTLADREINNIAAGIPLPCCYKS